MNKKPNPETKGEVKKSYYAGVGLILGVGIGAILGMLFFQNMTIGAGIGAALGLIFGASLDAQIRGKQSAD